MVDIHPEVRKTGRLEQYREVIRTGEPLFLEDVRVTRRLGEREYFIQAFKVRDGLGLITTDITEIKRFEKRLEALHRHATELASVESVEEIAEATLRVIKDVFGFQWSDFNVINDDRLVPLLIQDEDLRSNLELQLDGPGIIVRAYKTGKSQLVHDTRLDEDYVNGRIEGSEEWPSELAVPVKIGNKVVAVINIEDKKLGAFTPNDQKLLEIFAEHVASAIDRIERLNTLRFSEEKLRTLLEASRDAVFVLDREKYLYVNHSAAELLGFDEPNELIGRNAFDFVAPSDRERVIKITLDRQNGRNPLNRYEIRLLKKDGTTIDCETHVSLIEYDGKSSSLAFTRDITERKQMEKIRNIYQRRLEALHEHAVKLIHMNTVEEIAKFTFDTIELILGFETGSFGIVEKNYVKFTEFRGPSTITELSLDGVGVTVRAVKTGKTQRVLNTRIDESYISGRVESDPETLSEMDVPVKVGGEVVAVINIESETIDSFSEEDQRLVEILAEHVASALSRLGMVEKLERSVNEKTEELLAAERFTAVGRISSMVGHDLRGPLQTIKNAVFLLEKDPGSAEGLRETIDEAVDYAVNMLEELHLNVADSSVQLQEVNLGALILKAVVKASIPDSVKTGLHIADGLDSVFVDLLKIRRVLDNLIRNAVEAMPDGGTLKVSAEVDEEGIEITVRDTGSGIPDDLMPDIFKAFVTSKPKGMGLGLPYCKRAVEAHGGTITVESEEGVGTTFTVRLPLESK